MAKEGENSKYEYDVWFHVIIAHGLTALPLSIQEVTVLCFLFLSGQFFFFLMYWNIALIFHFKINFKSVMTFQLISNYLEIILIPVGAEK